MDAIAVIFGYCERTGPGLWAEPLNAVSNLAFLVAGVVALRRLRRTFAPGPPPSVLLVMVVVLPVIGAGSFTFHTVAGWTRVLDELPILVFVLSYLVVAVHLFLGVPWRLAWPAAPAYLLFATAIETVLGGLGWGDPGMRYVPVLLAVLGLATALILSGDAGRQRYGAGTSPPVRTSPGTWSTPSCSTWWCPWRPPGGGRSTCRRRPRRLMAIRAEGAVLRYGPNLCSCSASIPA